MKIEPLTPDRWVDFVDLFESDSMCRRCWCVAHRVSHGANAALTPEARRQLTKQRVLAGPPPGLLAYLEDLAVGWLALGPRPDTPDWNTPRKASRPETEGDGQDPSVWAATCFVVRSRFRGKKITEALLQAGIVYARANGARRLEACPMEHDQKRSQVGLFVGPKRVFERAGFTVVAERKPGRPLMRLSLE